MEASKISRFYLIIVIDFLGYVLGLRTLLVSRRVRFRDISCHFRGVIPLAVYLFLSAHIANYILKETLIMISIRSRRMIDK